MASTGRADLLRAWAAAGEGGLAAMARVLGYEGRAPSDTVETRAERDGEDGEELAVAVEMTPSESPGPSRADAFAPIPFWYLEEIEFRDPEPEDAAPPPAARPIGTAGLGRRPGAPPSTPPLAPNARLLPVLRRRLASVTASREVDVETLAERLSRGRLVRRIPFRRLAAWAPRVAVLVDRSSRLIPFWDDQDRLLRLLRRWLGHAAVRAIYFQEGYEFPWRHGRARFGQPIVEPGTMVLALGDLGFLADGAEQARWRRVGEGLWRAGSRRAALVPCPANRWERGLARSWCAVEWERPRGAPRWGEPLEENARRARAERLLGLLAFASRIEPGLLRAMRRLLPAMEADAGTEADAWSHPEVGGGFSPAADLDRGLRERLQARFATQHDETKRGAVEALRRWRAGLPVEIWLDEVLGLVAAARLPEGALLEEEIEEARQMWRRVAATVGGAAAAPRLARAVKAFVGRSLGSRQPRAVWDDGELRPALWRAWESAWPDEGEVPLPAGVGPEVRGAARGELRRWQARQVGGELRFSPAAAMPESGSPLVSLETALPEIGVHAGDERSAPARSLEAAVALPEAPALMLSTERARATLRRMERPAWASAAGRDRFGLWASFEVEGVEQRMRHIPPGRFFMGSPEDEPGRYANEGPRHLETISQGFWLAETLCTQELWQAVTGENPSKFRSTGRPVERVSFEDCERFFQALEARAPGLRARFPTEIEWEYACRAGTDTATYAGPLEILGERNAPGIDAIAWYGGNSGEGFEIESGYDSGEWKEKQYQHAKAGTRPLALKKPNPWGLYDMLGNLFEWCESFWRSRYDAEPKRSHRAVRGGSWFSLARFVRAAYRIPVVPSMRWIYLGLRLAASAEPSHPGENTEPE